MKFYDGFPRSRLWYISLWLLRIGFAFIFIPAGWQKLFVGGYLSSASQIIDMSSGVVPFWLAVGAGYVLPIAELYIGLAVILGFGRSFTKGLTLLVTLSIFCFWALKLGSEFQWFMNVNTWLVISSISLMALGFGPISLDNLIWSHLSTGVSKQTKPAGRKRPAKKK